MKNSVICCCLLGCLYQNKCTTSQSEMYHMALSMRSINKPQAQNQIKKLPDIPPRPSGPSGLFYWALRELNLTSLCYLICMIRYPFVTKLIFKLWYVNTEIKWRLSHSAVENMERFSLIFGGDHYWSQSPHLQGASTPYFDHLLTYVHHKHIYFYPFMFAWFQTWKSDYATW